MRPIIDHESPEVKQKYNSTLSLTSALDWRWVSNATPLPLYPQERDPVPILREAGWAPRPIWTGKANLTRTVFRTPDHPAP